MTDNSEKESGDEVLLQVRIPRAVRDAVAVRARANYRATGREAAAIIEAAVLGPREGVR